MLTIAVAILGVLFALYYSYIKNNEYHYQESRLRSLNANFKIIKKQLDNGFQKLSSTNYESIFSSKSIIDKAMEEIKAGTPNWDDILKDLDEAELDGNQHRADDSDLLGKIRKAKTIYEIVQITEPKIGNRGIKGVSLRFNIERLAEKYIEAKHRLTEEKTNTKSVWKFVESDFEVPNQLRQEFDEYILIFKNNSISVDKETKVPDKTPTSLRKPIIRTSLDGTVALPDSLEKLDPYNLGLVLGVPKEKVKYQFFSRNYTYKTSLDPTIEYGIQIIGFVETEKYKAANRQLDAWIITLLSLFLLLALFGLPYFKMLFIAEDERVFSNDVILSGISIVVGAPVLILFFLSLMKYYNDYELHIPDKLKNLTQDLRLRFEEENASIVKSLYSMDLNREDLLYDTIDNGPHIDSIYPSKDRYNKHLKFVSKTKNNTKGEVYYHIKLIANKGIENTKNLGQRPYFKAFKDSSNIWSVAHNKSLIKYAMRPVVSIEDQNEEAVYILENPKDPLRGYRIGSSQLKSLHEAILPFGFQFAVIHKDGGVWFHSEKGRATLENLFDVTRHNNKFLAAIAGRIDARGKLTYRDEGKLYHVSPIKGTDLSVVAFYDIELLRSRISEVLTMSCIILAIALIVILIITILSLIIRNPKLGLYHYDRFLFDFLTPKKSLARNYMVLSSSLLLGLFLLIIVALCAHNINPIESFLFCILLPINSYIIVFYALHPHGYKPDIKYCIRDFILFTTIVLLNLLFFKINGPSTYFTIIFSLQTLYILYIVWRKFQYVKKPKNATENKTWLGKKEKAVFKAFADYCSRLKLPYKYWYALFLFSWLLLAVIFPTFLIFTNIETKNDGVWLRIDQYYMAHKYMDKENNLKINLSPFKSERRGFESLYETFLKEGQYHPNLCLEFVKGEQGDGQEQEPTTELDNFLWSIWPAYDNRINLFQGLIKKRADDLSWAARGSNDDSEAPRDFTLTNRNQAKIVIGYEVPQHKIKRDYTLLFVKSTGFAIILLGLFSLILFFIDRYFAFRFSHLKANDFDTNKEAQYAAKFSRIINDVDSNSGLLLIGPPFSGKLNFAKEILNKSVFEKSMVLSMLQLDAVKDDADLKEIMEALTISSEDQADGDWETCEVFIIDHLEHNIKSYRANHLKLKLILFLISKHKRIILISEVYPSQIFAMYENTPESPTLPWGSLEDDFNSWRNILSAFPQVLIGITKNPEKTKLRCTFGLDKKEMPSLEDINLLVGELGYSKFLPNLAPVIVAKSMKDEKKPCLDIQHVIMHTQNLAHGYYNDIWNTLPTRERYLLYDLAKDGFMNIKNRNSLFSLMKKGLIVWKDGPRIFNYSFKNFVVTSVSLNEALRLENKNRGNGSWANTRILLYLVIVAIIVFIGLGNPEFIQDFEALITALGGLGAIIPLVSRMLASGGQKT